MFRKLTILTGVTALAMAMTWNVPAQESGEASVQTEEESVQIWQGYSEGVSFTYMMDGADGTAVVCSTASDGTMTFADGTFETDENGNFVITAQDGSGLTWQTAAVSTCGKTVSGMNLLSGEETEISLVRADPAISGLINEYAWYAGLSDDGDAYTYGISLDCTSLIFGFYTPDDETLYETKFSLEITDSGDGVLSGIAVDEEGSMFAFSYEMIDENALHARITLNGESCETSAVEARIFTNYEEEA